jgi:hypothetical protein
VLRKILLGGAAASAVLSLQTLYAGGGMVAMGDAADTHEMDGCGVCSSWDGAKKPHCPPTRL